VDLTAPTAEDPLTVPIVDGLALAEIIDQLESDDPDRRYQLAITMTLITVRALSTVHDLETFETLTDNLKLAPEVHTAAEVRAQAAIEFEYNQLLDAALEADEVEAAAHNLAQWAQRYNIALEIGPLLDRADDLRQEVTDPPYWPDADASDDDFADDMNPYQIFAQLSTSESSY
jgi:hypothetical protein